MRWTLAVLAASLALGCQAPAAVVEEASEVTPDVGERESFLHAFARGYYPGRSGQVFYILEPGDILLREPMGLYRFMHGSAWDYDSRIPLLFYGPGFVAAGARPGPARQQDVAPTLLSLIDVPPTATMTGRALDVFAARAGRAPKAVLLLVMDGMRADYLDAHEDRVPTLARMRREGAFFPDAKIDYLPTVTSAGHTTVATGADPRFHGIAGNGYYDRRTGETKTLFEGMSPANVMVLGLADLWRLSAGEQAVVIAQGTTPRATVSLAGGGACRPNGSAVVMAMFDYGSGGWVTYNDCYELPDYLAAMNARPIWESTERVFRDLPLDSGRAFVTTDLFPAFQAEALTAMIRRESVGEDAIPDLVLVNFKTLDYVGHYYGPESAEIGGALAALDREIAALLDLMTSVAGEDGFVVALTSDHGMPSEPDRAMGRDRRFIDDLLEELHGSLDPEQKRLLYPYLDTANLQLYVDEARLRELGLDLADVVRAVEDVAYVRAAFSEDEVRKASGQR